MAGKSTEFDQIVQLLDMARINFPDASLVAFRNGRQVKLENAIKNRIN